VVDLSECVGFRPPSLCSVLCDVKDGRQLFGEFLRNEFSEENLEFWFACEQYRSCDDDDQLTATAQQIYEDFVAPSAPRQVRQCDSYVS